MRLFSKGTTVFVLALAACGANDPNDIAAITSGPFAGDLGAVIGQPTTFLRIALP